MKDQAALSAQWHRLARGTAWKINVAWWLERSLPLWTAAAVAGFAIILWLRSRGWSADMVQIWPWAAGAVAVLALAGWLLARRHFVSPTQAMVRLESELRLHNALTVARDGLGTWPALPSCADDRLRWRWQRVGGPLGACVLCILAALWIPVTPEVAAALPAVEPQSWAQMEEWLEKLQEEEIIPPEEKEDAAAKIAGLRDQPKEKWFSHESLNASDTLREQLQRDIQQLGKNLGDAERSLNALGNYGDQLSLAAREQLLQDFDEALAGLKSSGLELDPALLKELSQIDPKNMKTLSKEQLDQLRQGMKKKSGVCDGMCQNPGFLGDGACADDELAAILGMLKEQGGGPGNGGINRGPGTAPITLSEEENRFGTDKNEAVSNTDLSRAQIGNVIGIQDGKHEVDKTSPPITSAGAVQNAGQGGGQVWKESLTPEEKAVLKRVFQ